MSGLNKLMIIGFLGSDPELRFTPLGKAVCRFSVAVDSGRRSTDGEVKRGAEWFHVVAWEKLAETCNQYLTKGKRVYIEGSQRTRKWHDEKRDVDHERCELVAQVVTFLSAKDPEVAQGVVDSASGGPVDGAPEEDKVPF